MPDGPALVPPAAGAEPTSSPDGSTVERPAVVPTRDSPAAGSTRDPLAVGPAMDPPAPAGDRAVALVAPDLAAAATYDDEERPARQLTGPIGAGVAVVAFAVALLVLWQVFRPLSQGSQFYLIIFLAGVLPLVFLAYRSGLRLPGRLARRVPDPDAPATVRRDLPTAADWLLAGLALVVCLYPVLPFSIGDAAGG